MLTSDHFVTARAALARELAGRRAERFGREVSGPAFDHPVMEEAAHDDPPAPPLVFHLIYQDAKGDYSGRVITLQAIRREAADIRLSALCHWRNKFRMFMASRVVEVTDLATGEVHEDALAYFGGHPLLQALTADSLERVSLETLAMQECRDELTVLTFVAASDGLYGEDEQDEVVKHVLDRFPDEEVTERGVRQRIRCFVPDERAFEVALARLAAGHGDAKALMRSMRRVVDADGEVDAEEVAFVSEVETALRAAGRI